MYEICIKDNYRYFTVVSIFYGIVFAFCMYKNLFGWTFLLYAITTVIVINKFLKKANLIHKKETKFIYIGVILCGVSTCLTANILIQFLNWCCMLVLLMSLMINQMNEERNDKILEYINKMIRIPFATIGNIFLPLKNTKEIINSSKKERTVDKEKWKPIILGGGMAIGVLFVVVPLLAGSDIVFNRIIKSAFSWMNFEGFNSLIEMFNTLFGVLITFMAGFLLIYAFFYASCRVNSNKETEKKDKQYKSLTGIVFTSIIASVYLLYSMIQIRYLFLKAGLPEGISYSEYAHAGFWQLVLVVMINVSMVILCSELYEKNKWLNYMITIISLCTYVMMLSAAYRMKLYIDVYHLTFLRLCVLWFIAALAIVMAGVIISIYKKDFQLVNYMIAVSAVSYLIFSFSQPDYWIAKYNVSHIEQLTCADLEYMMCNLSLDAAPIIAEIDPKEVSSDDGDGCIYYYENAQENSAEIMMKNYFQEVSQRCGKIGFRQANFSKIRAKQIAGSF